MRSWLHASPYPTMNARSLSKKELQQIVARSCGYSNVLRALLSQEKQKRTSVERTHPSSHTPYRSLSTSEKITRMHRLHTLQRSTHQQLERLKAKLAATVEKNASPVDDRMHEDLSNIVAAQSPHMIKWCVYLRHLSSFHRV